MQSEDEIAEMKRKFKIMTHQIDQLKEEIQTKDSALINEHFAYKKLQDEMNVVKRKLAKRKDVLGTADTVRSFRLFLLVILTKSPSLRQSSPSVSLE